MTRKLTRAGASAAGLFIASASWVIPAGGNDAWRSEVVDTALPQLTQTLIGTWFEIDALGNPKKSLFTPGIKACPLPLDGERGGDLSFRREGQGFQLATLGAAFHDVRIAPAVDASVKGLRVDVLTVHMLIPASDGAPRIHVDHGPKSFDSRLQKCP
ncbi:MAG: hypothetical protein SGI91_06575 [Alphaproteobacteria bacterium]|nr:hypothetical protein [Alphaproteobacteria bacterium]